MNTPDQQIHQAKPEFRQCFKCNFEGVTPYEVCPRCQKKLYSASGIRTRGIVVMVCGLFIAGLMTAVAIGVAILLAGAMNDPSSARRINSESGMLVVVYVFFVVLIGLGLQFVVMGGWMAVFGKRNRILLWIMWAGILIVAGFGAVLRFFL